MAGMPQSGALSSCHASTYVECVLAKPNTTSSLYIVLYLAYNHQNLARKNPILSGVDLAAFTIPGKNTHKKGCFLKTT